MKRLFWLVFILLMVACGGDGDDATEPVATETPSAPQVVVLVPQAPVFSSPATTSEIIVNLFEGEARTVVGRSVPDAVGVTYYEIDLGNRTGWIASTQVEFTGDDSGLFLFDPAMVPPTNTLMLSPTSDAPTVRIKVARAVVLNNPQRDAETVATVFENETFTALQVTEPNALGDVFYQVQLGTQTGWLLSTQVEINGDPSAIAVAAQPTSWPTNTLELTLTPPEIPTTPASTLEQTPEPSRTPVPQPTLTFTPWPSSTATAHPDGAIFPQPPPTGSVDTQSLIQPWEPPPLDITIPENWEELHVLVPVASSFAAGNIPMSVYEGPLGADITGTIWILWGFPNILASPFGELDMWSDGIQMLRGVLFRGCNIGIGQRTEYPIGDQMGTGTTFSAVDCEEGNDIAGWFSALQVQGGNYVFFIGVRPVDRVLAGTNQLQTIINTVRFHDLASE